MRLSSFRPKSFDAQIIELATPKLGPLPVKLKARLTQAIWVLRGKFQVPRENVLEHLLADIKSWTEFLSLLEDQEQMDRASRGLLAVYAAEES